MLTGKIKVWNRDSGWGFIEGDDINKGIVDVVVTDGFSQYAPGDIIECFDVKTELPKL